MSDNLKGPTKIKIYAVEGGTTRDQDDLRDCYFVQLSGDNLYQFYSPTNRPIQTVPPFVSTGSFTFILDDKLWSINLVIDPQNASGQWRNNIQLASDDDGSFQAQAGPTIYEVASSATA